MDDIQKKCLFSYPCEYRISKEGSQKYSVKKRMLSEKMSHAKSNEIISKPGQYRIIISRIIIRWIETKWNKNRGLKRKMSQIKTPCNNHYPYRNIPSAESHKKESNERCKSKEMNNTK